MTTFNIYCDESCHLENDHQKVMILGALTCPEEFSRSIAKEINEIKRKHNLSPRFEIKWTKVSPGKIAFYIDLLKYFFSGENLFFRAVIIPDKTKLRHNDFYHDHDTWYYKMFFTLLNVLLTPNDHYRIYLDIKDSKSGKKIAKLQDILIDKNQFQKGVIERIQTIRSHEAAQLQLVDLLIGCILAANRNHPQISPSKQILVNLMRKLSQNCLTETTLVQEKKVNLLRWEARELIHED